MQITEGCIQKAHIPAYLDISRATFYRLLARKQFPPSVGNTFKPELWRKNDLELWSEWGMCGTSEFIKRKEALTTIK